MDYLTHILTFILGLGAGWTLNIVIKSRSSNNSRRTVQKGNNVGGDMAGGDIKK